MEFIWYMLVLPGLITAAFLWCAKQIRQDKNFWGPFKDIPWNH